MDARAPQISLDGSHQRQKHGADHIAPDCTGQNFYAIDRGLRDLLQLYLQPADFRTLEPHFTRLGALAGGRLDELARAAESGFSEASPGLARAALRASSPGRQRETVRSFSTEPVMPSYGRPTDRS